jgi:hypothetical protein
MIGKDSTKQLVYYWFEQRGRKIENEWWSKWYLISDAIVRNRTDGALVRLTTPVYPTESEADADRRLQAFTRDLMPALTGYLPADETTKSTSIPLTPAKAGVQGSMLRPEYWSLDSRVRGNERIMLGAEVRRPTSPS